MFRRRRHRPPEEAFTDEVAETLRRAPGVEAVERIGVLQLRVVLASRGAATAYLENLFREARLDPPEARARRIGRYVGMLSAPPEVPGEWEQAAARLMPALRPVGWRAVPQGDDRAAYRLFSPFVDRVLAVDQADSMAFVTESHLARWEVEFERAEQRAVENLTSSALSFVAGPVPGCAAVSGPNGYVSSWMLAAPAFEQAARELHGAVIALAPSRDSCVFAPVADASVLGAALAWAEGSYRSAPRRLSPVPYAIAYAGAGAGAGGGAGAGEGAGGSLAGASSAVAPWAPPPGHPCAWRVAEAERVLAYHEYETQRGVLQELFDRSGIDVEVASMHLLQTEGGEAVVSVAPWHEGVVDSWLPVADEILFGGRRSSLKLRVAFDDAQRIAGSLIEPVPGLYPPRVRVRGWPRTQLGELRRHARPS